MVNPDQPVRDSTWRKRQLEALLRHFAAPRDRDFQHPDLDRLPHQSFLNDVEDHPPRVREAADWLLSRLDRAELSRIAGVKFTHDQILELATATVAYADRFRAPYQNEGFLTDEEWQDFLDNPQGLEMRVRRAYVRKVLAIWQDAGGTTGNLTWHKELEAHNGPVVLLVRHLLGAAGQRTLPEQATIRHDIAAITTGYDRHRPKRA